MGDRVALLGELRELIARSEGEIDIGEAALLLAAFEQPDRPLEPYRAHLAELAEAAQGATSRTHSIDMQHAALQRLLVERFGYSGDRETYDDPRNANLLDVIDRRRGLPVALGILWLHAGRAYGADMMGLSFPSHFLIRLGGRGQRMILDPFNDGQLVATQDLRRLLKTLHGVKEELTPSHYTPVLDVDVLLRLQNNIKLRAISANEVDRALQVLETMTTLAPGRSELWWETAMLQSRAGNLATAIATLEGFLADHSADDQHPAIADLLQRLRSRVN